MCICVCFVPGHTCLFPELPVLRLDRWQEIRSLQTTGQQFFTVFANLSKRTIVIFNQTGKNMTTRIPTMLGKVGPPKD